MRLKFNFTIIREDLRKLALALMGGAILGLVIDSDKITLTEGWMIFSIGFIQWLVAVAFSASKMNKEI